MVFEDLKTRNMMASAAGTVEEPGTNVAQKRGLSRYRRHFLLSRNIL